MNSLHINDNHLGCISTVTGVTFNYLQPTAAMVNIEDICHALGSICRYAGHISPFYSVAQHSVLVAMLAPAHMRKEALAHDFAEAYVGDLVKPLKNIVGAAFDDVEARVMAAIVEAFGLNPAHLQAVKTWDKMALELEHSALRLHTPEGKAAWQELWAEHHYAGNSWQPVRAALELQKWWWRALGV